MCVQTTRENTQEKYLPGEFVTENLTSTIGMYLATIWHRFLTTAQKLLTDFHIYELVDEAAIYLAQHPVLTVIVIAVAISCGIPVLMFVVFAVLTVLFTFAGFIVIEGTLLTVGSVLLCGFVLAILIILVILAATVAVAYLGFVEVYGLLQSSPENSPLAHFLPRKQTTQQSSAQ